MRSAPGLLEYKWFYKGMEGHGKEGQGRAMGSWVRLSIWYYLVSGRLTPLPPVSRISHSPVRHCYPILQVRKLRSLKGKPLPQGNLVTGSGHLKGPPIRDQQNFNL